MSGDGAEVQKSRGSRNRGARSRGVARNVTENEEKLCRKIMTNIQDSRSRRLERLRPRRSKHDPLYFSLEGYDGLAG
jgi:hypothetical protein